MGDIFHQNTHGILNAGRPQQTDIVNAITTWCEALYGCTSLETALANLVQGLGAEAGTLVRTHMNEFHPIRIASYDALSRVSVFPLDATFADGYFGKYLTRPKPATVWLASTHAEIASASADSTLETWQAARRFNEFAVLILAAGSVTRDHIELHFRDPLSPEVLATLSSVLPAVARTWATRQVGLITRTVVNHRRSHRTNPSKPQNMSLLASSNPARLSRAEFRVCLLLSRGLSVANTVSELGVTESTVRTHLRNIYAKSNTSSIAELIFCLIGPQQIDNEEDIQCA